MDKIQAAFEILLQETTELAVDTSVAELNSTPSVLEFTRDYYAKNTPVVIRNAIETWPALTNWTPEYFQSKFGDKMFEVAVTPNGYADGIAKLGEKEYFVLPLEEKMTITDFLHKLDDKNGPVLYIQKQNSNFLTDFSQLLTDIDTNFLQFADQCFNKTPDAINFWMGDKRAITSMHKDPYDNIYCVISGYKDFILLPPHQLPYIPRKLYPVGEYKRKADGEFVIEPILHENELNHLIPLETEWVSINPLEPNLKMYPEYAKAKPLRVRVNAGDVLFLPNYWYHHVRQSHKCIAMNYWYDMEYDSRYCYFRMLEKLTENNGKRSNKLNE